MSQVPQDPRQLARDILSGKVKIEDLARMRQQRAGGAPGGGAGTAGAGRPAGGGMQPIPVQRPMIRPPQQQVVQRMPPAQVKQVPVRGSVQTQRPVARQMGRSPQQVRGPQIVPARAPATVRPVTAPLAPMQMEYKQAQDSPAKVAAVVPKGFGIKELLRDKRGLRQGILLAEVLGRPVGMRDG